VGATAAKKESEFVAEEEPIGGGKSQHTAIGKAGPGRNAKSLEE